MIALVNRCIAYAAACLSAALAARYGWKVADTPVDALLRGCALFVVAIIAAHSMAWASKAWRDRSWFSGAAIALGGIVCFAVTLAGGIGTIAGGSAAVQAEREYAAAVRQVTIQAEADAASALQAAQESARRECATGRGRRCVDAEARQTEAQARADKARTAIGMMAPTPAPDPQASAIARLLNVDPALAGALYAFGLSLAIELGAMLALLFATLERADVPLVGSAGRQKGAVAAVAAPVATVALDTPSITVIGSVAEFLADILDAAPGAVTDLAPMPGLYRSWCSQHKRMPVDDAAFAAAFAQVCKDVGLTIKRRAGKLYCVDMRISA